MLLFFKIADVSVGVEVPASSGFLGVAVEVLVVPKHIDVLRRGGSASATAATRIIHRVDDFDDRCAAEEGSVFVTGFFRLEIT